MSSSDAHDLMSGARVFVRVYRLPAQLTNGYCFGAGVPVVFTNVDWFEAPIAEGRAPLIEFIRGKRYYDRRASFLVLGDRPDFVFVIADDPPPNVTRFKERPRDR